MVSEVIDLNYFNFFFKRKKERIILPDNNYRENLNYKKPQLIKSDEKKVASSDFIKSMIHELKNPISAISGISQILQEERDYNLSDSERMDYLNCIDESINDLNELVHDLLDVSVDGNEETSFSIDLTKEIDVKEIVRRSVRLNKNYASRNGIKISSEIADDIYLIRLDLKRTKQIIANLVSNSVKYSPEKTTIKIVLKNIIKSGKKYLEISVSDQGFGMTKEQVAIAFQKYKTINNPNSGKVDSFGLGLPIVKQLVELQRGNIQVISSPNQGTNMIITFPY